MANLSDEARDRLLAEYEITSMPPGEWVRAPGAADFQCGLMFDLLKTIAKRGEMRQPLKAQTLKSADAVAGTDADFLQVVEETAKGADRGEEFIVHGWSFRAIAVWVSWEGWP